MNYTSYSPILRTIKRCPFMLKTPENTAFGITSVRFRKRRDNLPRRAPSKLYYVRQPTITPDDENEILTREMRLYNTKMKSIYSFLKSQGQPINFLYKDKKTSTADEDAELLRALEINDAWNAEIAEARKQWRSAEQTERWNIFDTKMDSYISELETKQRQMKEAVARKLEKQKQTIDLENIDEELEKFLDGPSVNHNFAITKRGEKIVT